MLNFPAWKTASILLTCLFGLMLTLPNAFYSRVEAANDARAELEAGLPATDERAAAAAGWPSWMPSQIVNLGLDLRGGAHLLLEVDVSGVYAERIDGFWPEVRDAVRDIDTVERVRRIDDAPDVMRVRIDNPDALSEAMEVIRNLTQPTVSLTGVPTSNYVVSRDGDDMIVTLSDTEKLETDNRTMAQTLEIIRRRVDEAGTREPTIQRQGTERVLVQVPGIGSAEELIELLGATAKLGFHHVERIVSTADGGSPGAGNVIYPDMDDPSISYVVNRRAVVGGEDLVDAQPAFDQNGLPSVNFRFNPSGARDFGDYTLENIGNPFAIVLDEEVVSAPTIQSHIPGGSGQITGQFSVQDSTRLAILLRAGALPAELTVLEQRTIGPELGADSIAAGRIACIVALGAVLVFMVLSYGMFGLFANIALIFNIVLIFAILSRIGATLTLPGIAGLVLTIGMAVDANVLIFERIREELKTARGPARAIEQGFSRALSAIIDANITTLIAAVILFAIGSGPVRGFAVTLGVGIVTSVFTAFYVTRLFIVLWFDRTRPKTLEV